MRGTVAAERHAFDARSSLLADHQQWQRKEVVPMALDFQQERQQAHALLDLLPLAKLGAVRSLLEVMVEDDDADEALTEEDRNSLRTSEKYFRDGRPGVPFEQVVADLGVTMEQIRGARPKE